MVAEQISGFPTMLQENCVNIFIPGKLKFEGKYFSVEVEILVKINNRKAIALLESPFQGPWDWTTQIIVGQIPETMQVNSD